MRTRRPSQRNAAAGLVWLTLLTLTACAGAPRPADLAAAARNRSGLYAGTVDLFGRPETGWAVYAPRIEAEVDSGPAPADTPGFARAVACWRRRHGLGASGEVDGATLAALKAGWQAARPFVTERARGVCPEPPAPDQLGTVRPQESLGGRPLQLRRGALAAYRRMVRDARRAEPALAGRPDLLTLFSAYRSPERDAARCAAEGNCQGVVRASCSAHRTGLALDLTLDAAPGLAVDSTADANRLAMVRGLAYRWLVANAPRYGFVNYAFEPWHWEWTGARP